MKRKVLPRGPTDAQYSCMDFGGLLGGSGEVSALALLGKTNRRSSSHELALSSSAGF